VLDDGQYAVVAHVEGVEGAVRLTASGSFYVTNGQVSEGTPSAEVLEYLRRLQPGFRVEGMAKAANLRPRGTRILPVRFLGTAEQPLRLYPLFVDWALDDEGQVAFAPPGTNSRSAVPMLSCMDDSVRAEKNRPGVVRVKAQPPPGAAGEYYAAVVLNEQGKDAPLNEPALIRPRACLLTLVVEGKTAPALHVAEATVDAPGTADSVFHVTIENLGDASSGVAGQITARDEKGQVAETGLSFGGPELVCLAGGRRRVEVPWARALWPGRYVAEVLVAPPGSSQWDKYQFAFEVGPAASEASGPSNEGGETAGQPSE
jgi:hypothetical protein